MASRISALCATGAAALVAGLVLATPAVAQTLLGPGIVDPEFADGNACWQDDGFMFSAVNRLTGALEGQPTRVPITPAPDTLTQNGPEPLLTRNGVECIGSALGGGVVRFGAAGGGIVAGTDRLGVRAGYAPPYPCDPARYIVLDRDNRTYLWQEGALFFLLSRGTALRWLSCEEVIFFRASRYGVLDVGSGAITQITPSGFSLVDAFPLTFSWGERVVIIEQGARADLFRDSGAGWALARSLVSPDREYPYLNSLELFEWQGRAFVSGIVKRSSGTSRSRVFLYDIDNASWRFIGSRAVSYSDPETMVLDDGRLAVYFTVAAEATTRYVLLSP